MNKMVEDFESKLEKVEKEEGYWSPKAQNMRKELDKLRNVSWYLFK